MYFSGVQQRNYSHESLSQSIEQYAHHFLDHPHHHGRDRADRLLHLRNRAQRCAGLLRRGDTAGRRWPALRARDAASTMTTFQYHPDILARYPNVVGGVIVAHGVQNGSSSPDLLAAYQAEQRATLARIGDTPLS